MLMVVERRQVASKRVGAGGGTCRIAIKTSVQTSLLLLPSPKQVSISRVHYLERRWNGAVVFSKGNIFDPLGVESTFRLNGELNGKLVELNFRNSNGTIEPVFPSSLVL